MTTLKGGFFFIFNKTVRYSKVVKSPQITVHFERVVSISDMGLQRAKAFLNAVKNCFQRKGFKK